MLISWKEEETLLDTSGNWSRIQRATPDLGNGAVVNGVSVDGMLIFWTEMFMVVQGVRIGVYRLQTRDVATQTT